MDEASPLSSPRERQVSTAKQRYARVNAAWPETIPSMTFEEGRRGAQLIWRRYTGRSLPWKCVPTSGVRQTALGVNRTKLKAGHRRAERVLRINPGTGFKDLVHALSHYVVDHLKPGGKTGHGAAHASYEREMIEFVVEGWLNGKLKPKPKPKTPKPRRDIRAERHAAVLKKIKKWKAKAERSAKALKKLQRQDAYYRRTSQRPSKAAAEGSAAHPTSHTARAESVAGSSNARTATDSAPDSRSQHAPSSSLVTPHASHRSELA